MIDLGIDGIRPSSRLLGSINEATIDGLILSIKQCGLLQPVMVTRSDDCSKVLIVKNDMVSNIYESREHKRKRWPP